MSEQNSQNNSDDDDHHQNCCRCQDEINGRQLNDNDTISSIPTTTNVNTTNSGLFGRKKNVIFLLLCSMNVNVY